MIKIENNKEKEKVLIVGTDIGAKPYSVESSMKELAELVKAAGGEVVAEVVQNLDRLNPRYLIGSGKVKEIKEHCENLEIETVVFNDELTAIQIRNLEDVIDRKIVDRTNLILDIFALRAKTKEGMLQVKLAQLNYRLTRLIKSKNLSRTGGGIGTRGPGEQKLETDRRHILREVDSIKRALKRIEKTRATMRKKREDVNIPIISLVGYTNAGKSTILNKMLSFNSENSPKEVFAKDMLFATLDPSLRKVKLPSGKEVILSDTVGFVSKLPTKLIEAFKSTLEEVKYSDLILHVIDASEDNLEIQYNTTMEILKELEIVDKPIITVFNKVDLIEKEDFIFNYDREKPNIFISALNNKNILELLELVEKELFSELIRVKLLIPFDKSKDLNRIMGKYKVNNLKYLEEGTFLELDLLEEDVKKFERFRVKGD